MNTEVYAVGVYICLVCEREGKGPGERFKVPADEEGPALMGHHLTDHRLTRARIRRARTRWDMAESERIRKAAKCRRHRGQLADNCALCRSEQLAEEDA